MKRINNILQNRQYIEYIKQIEMYERDREFCKHDMVHFLDVCRLANILYLQDRQAVFDRNRQIQEETEDIHQMPDTDMELIYAAGLLHDIGRWQEYKEGICHETASAQLAGEILRECGFEPEEIREICFSISNHRNKEIKDEKSLSGILYRADKMSRPCFACKAESKCDWDINKKNRHIIY